MSFTGNFDRNTHDEHKSFEENTSDMIKTSGRVWTALALAAAITVAMVSPTYGFSLEFPHLNLVPENAADEIRAEDRISEVLNQDANYRSLFHSINNQDIPLGRFVRPGEELRYQANWRGLPAGTIRLSAKRVAKLKNRPVFVFELNVESNDFLNAFYPVHTNINSYVDAQNGRSYLIRRRVSERNRGYVDRLEFRYDSRLASGIPDPVSRYSIVGENGQEMASAPFPIPENMQDMLSIIYYIRGMNLQNVGDSCSFLVGGRKMPVVTKVTVVGREHISIPSLGVFDCLVVEPTSEGANLSANVVATRGAEKVWLERNTLIPVMVSGELPKPLGEVVATLVQADNCVLMRYANNRQR